jgi:hypothetical protein
VDAELIYQIKIYSDNRLLNSEKRLIFRVSPEDQQLSSPVIRYRSTALTKIMKAAASTRKKIEYIGTFEDHSILIGSHGDTKFKARGSFNLSGIVYSPKYSVTLSIEGTGKIRFRGICHALIIKKLSGDCELDVSQLACKDLRIISMKKNSKVIAGKVRTVQAMIFDDATISFTEKPLISNIQSGESQSGKVIRSTEPSLK